MPDSKDPSLLPMLPEGTRVVLRRPAVPSGGGHERPKGAVGVVIRAPADAGHAYRVRLPDGAEVAVKRQDLAILKHFQEVGFESPGERLAEYDLHDYVILRCVVGSRAFGLSREGSDTDIRGVYLPPAEVHWSLYGVPEQLEDRGQDEVYWELQKFLVLALKANPNILECLYTPRIEFSDAIGEELLGMREAFLSKMVYQTYNRYVMSQFKKFTSRREAKKEINWKHAMHLIRLLLSGITVLREGFVPIDVGPWRDQLLAIREGAVAWEEIERMRLELHAELDDVFARSTLPDRPDYEAANAFLIRARLSRVP